MPGSLERMALKVLDASESPQALTRGTLWLDAPVVNAVLICTEKRIILFQKRWFGHELTTLHYENITGVDELTTLRDHGFAIRAVAGSVAFYPRIALKQERERAEACIRYIRSRSEALRGYGAPSTPTPPSRVSAADRLREAKKLLDEGLLTQGEFDAKKQELLKEL
ncbi:MAG: SHOCT domain-containing protein [Alphaproteobacteria bacterium]|nr:SHOCT domain-containing protein [Alphaproteobacteria bacterium]